MCGGSGSYGDLGMEPATADQPSATSRALEVAESRVAELEDELAALTRSGASCGASQSSAGADEPSVVARAEAAEARVAELEDELTSVRAESFATSFALQTATAQIEKVKAAASEQTAKLEEQISVLQGDVIAGCSDELAALQGEHDALRRKCAALEKRLGEASAAGGDDVADLQAEIAALEGGGL